MSEYDRSKLFLLKSKIKRATPPTGTFSTRPSMRTPPEMRSPAGVPVRATPPEQRHQGGYTGSQPVREVVPMRSQPVSSNFGSSPSRDVRAQAPQNAGTPQYVQAPRAGQAFPRSAPQVLQKQQSGLAGLPAESGPNEAHNECPDCGRKFNDEAFPKHKKICKKVFMQKRKVFDAAKLRIQAIVEEATKSGGAPSGLLSQASRTKRPGPQTQAPRVSSGNAAPARPSGFGGTGGGLLGKSGAKNKTGWREKSAQFRMAMGSMRKENSEYSYQGNHAGAYSSKSTSQYTCPHCNRGFNEEAGKRHSLVCLRIFNSAGGRLQKGSGTLSHSTTRKVDSTSLRLGATPSRITPSGRSLPSNVAPSVRRR